MKKLRVAVLGINDVILRVLRREIDPRKVEIILFLDNDETKVGMYYMNIPVLSPAMEVFEEYAVDYVLIAALSAYEAVKKQLMDLKLTKEKIQPFLTDDLYNYCLGNLEEVDEQFIHSAYFEPSKWISKVIAYRKMYKEYLKNTVYSEKPEAWYNKSSLISHALGGVVNGKRIMYSNSKEAFTYSMKEGFRLIECDILGMAKGELILAHDYGRFYEAEEDKYSMMTGMELLELVKKYPDVSCLIDVKWDSHDEYALYLKEIEKTISDISKDADEYRTLKNQIIMEVYDEATIRIAKEKEFDVIFTQYRNPQMKYFMNTVNLCYKYGIRVVAMPLEYIFDRKKFIKILTDKKIKVFAFSTDSAQEYKELRMLGVTGAFTNYLTEEDIK